MTRSQIARYEMLVRVRAFGVVHRPQLPAGSAAGRAFDTLGSAVEALDTFAKAKLGSSRGGRHARKQARRLVELQLDAVARTAREIATTTPGFDEAFRIARSRNEQALLTTAALFAEQAEPVKPTFVALGLSTDFVERLNDAASQLRAAIDLCSAGARQHAAARAGVQTAVEQGFGAVRLLDVIVRNHFAADTATLASWARDRRIASTRRRGSGGAPDTADSMKGDGVTRGPAAPVPTGPVTPGTSVPTAPGQPLAAAALTTSEVRS